MYKYFLIFSLLFLATCHSKMDKQNGGIDPNDCPVSQVDQNDHFLNGIEELKKYKWNKTTKQAIVKIPNYKKLIITRGGCIHFIVDAEFYPKQKINITNGLDAIFNEVLWIANLLNDFNYKELKKAIGQKDYQVFKNQYITTITFNSKVLTKNSYAIIINTKENIFSISEYLQ
jgi:hypothetical protein